MSDRRPPAPPARSRLAPIAAGFNRHTVGLGVSMAVGYGAMFYSFAMVAPAIMAEFGWSRLFVFGSLSAATLAGVVAGPVAGRLLDRHGGRAVLSIGTVAASLALVAFSQSGSPAQFVAALFAVEAASAFVFYEAGFAMLAQIHGRDARLPISAVTLIAGFSSTLFWPLTAWLVGAIGWRGALLALAAINLAVALPIHLSLPRHATAPAGNAAVDPSGSAAGITGRRRQGALAAMAVAFAAGAFAIAAVQAHFPRFFVDAGYSLAAAAGFGALIGPMQVVARILDILFGQSRHPVWVGIAANAALTLGVGLLLALPLGVAAAAGFAILFGAGQGMANIVRGAVPLAIFGPAGYATLSGNLGVLRHAAMAAAPVGVALVADRHGDAGGIALILAAAFLGFAALLPLVALARR